MDILEQWHIGSIYEDNHILVVEKPVNLPVQEDDSRDADMVNILKEYLKGKYNKPGNVFVGLVHRLDRPVGGVMVFARTSKAASRLSDQVRQRLLGKTYLAVVNGRMDKQQGSLHSYLWKDERTNTVYTVEKGREGAKEALLDYRVLEMTQTHSLVEVILHTGRPHQIRVQFASIGHPLYGDQKYGAHMSRVGEQLALWSHLLKLQHPTRQQEMQFTSVPPVKAPWNWFHILQE